MSRNGNRLMNNGGYSLAELLVVVSIIGIVLSMSALYGHEWLVGAQVEDQTREMFADLMNARVGAMQRNRVNYVTLASNQYAIYEDTSPAPDGDGQLDTSNDRAVTLRTTNYALNSGGTQTFSFSSCGLVQELTSDQSYTIRVVSTTDPNFNCIVIKPTRLLMGKWNGTDCTLQ